MAIRTTTETTRNENSFYVNPADLILDENTRPGEPEGVEELAASMAEHGQMVPCIVRRRAEDKKLVLVAGFRRYHAALRAGKQLWVVCNLTLHDEKEAYIAGVLENVRLNPNDVQEAKANASLIERFGLSLTEVAKLYGRDNTNRVSQLQKLLTLPQAIQDAVAQKTLSLHAALQTVGSEQKQQSVVASLGAGQTVTANDAATAGGGDEEEGTKLPKRNAKHLQNFIDTKLETADEKVVHLFDIIVAFLRGAKGERALLNAVENLQ